jgi:protein involved in polysaccharide export with SLBB domain
MIHHLQNDRYPVPEYYLGPGDELDIRIFELPNFNMTLRVAPDGTISVAPIGRIRVAGMTVQQVEEMLRKYLQERYIQDPHVSVNIRQFESQRYTVMGAVKNPGSFPLYRGKTVITALAEAGGLLEGAGIIAYLYRMDEKATYQRLLRRKPHGSGDAVSISNGRRPTGRSR